MDPAAPPVDELTSVEQAIAALQGQRGVLGDHLVDTALEPLLQKRDRLLAASVGEQRKLVTVLFGDLVDFTAVSARLDPEDVQQVMNRYFAACREAVEAEGGVVEKFIGDAVMAAFGVYRAREDDPHRAVRAAVAMHAGLEQLAAQVEAEHGVRVQMRIGIDTGEVLVTTLGGRAGEDFVVVGETVNRAARLQAEAPPGATLLSADTCRHVRGSFALQRVEGLRLKGIAEPVDGYVVLSGSIGGFWPETRGIEGVTTSTVGRELELGGLQKAFADLVEDRTPRIVTVVGEAGVGKSRLVHDLETWLAALPDPVWVLRGRASPTTEDVPHGLLRSVFADRLGIGATDTPAAVRQKWHNGVAALHGAGEDAMRAADTVAAWLGFPIGEAPDVAGLTADPEALSRRAGKVLLELFASLTERAPVVLLLEDLHWADAASLDWLAGTVAASPHQPLLVVATTRPTLLEQRPQWGSRLAGSTSVRLQPLSRRESIALVAQILQRVDDVPPSLTELVVVTAEGNPFYIEELVKWLVDEGVIDTSGDRWRVVEESMKRVRVPTTLRGVLQARIDALDRVERSVVERASVVGRVFWDRAVARLAASRQETPVDEAFDRLRSREVVFQRERSAFDDTREFSFRHALMRDVAYEGVLRARRRRYHLLAARWLEEVIAQSQRPDEHAAAVAHHYEESGESLTAARWYLRAGRHAASTFAGEDALRLLTRAEAMVPPQDVALVCDVLLVREAVLDRLGRRPEQRAVLDTLAGLPGLDRARTAQVHLAEGGWLFFHGDYPPAHERADQAAALALAEDRGDLELEALVLAGRSAAFANRHADARLVLARALERARARDDHRRAGESLRLLGVVATNVGETDLALTLLGEAREEYRQTGDLEAEALVTGQLGASLINADRLDEAKRASEEALAMFVATGHRLRQGIVLGNLATVAIEQGRLDDAKVHAVETLHLTAEVEDPEGVVSSLLRLGDVDRLTGDLTSARRHLEDAVEQGTSKELWYFTANALSSLVAVDLAEGRVDDAVSRAARAREVAELADIPHSAALAVFTAGLAARAAGDPPAPGLLREAATRQEQLGMEADRVECAAALAVALLDGDQPAEALNVLEKEVLPALADGVPPGLLEPGQPLLDAHRVLVAAGDERATELAAACGRYLAERAGSIRDPALRQGFLGTRVNQELARVAAG